MIGLPASSIVDSLSDLGYVFSTSEMVSEGECTAVDVEWNYKDIPHLNIVHSRVDGVTSYVSEDASSSLFVQRLLWFRALLAGVLYKSTERSMTYYFTMTFIVIIIETTWEELPESRTSARTVYYVGSGRILRLLHPIVHRALKKNYGVLMAEDLPMRDRRGVLRRRGYSYRADAHGVSFLDTLQIGRQNVIPAPAREDVGRSVISLSELSEGTTLVGSDDFDGVRLERSGAYIRAFPRMCSHDGASLDEISPNENDQLVCPWHARKCGSVFRVELESGQVIDAQLGNNSLRVEGDSLSIYRREREFDAGGDSPSELGEGG